MLKKHLPVEQQNSEYSSLDESLRQCRAETALERFNAISHILKAMSEVHEKRALQDIFLQVKVLILDESLSMKNVAIDVLGELALRKKTGFTKPVLGLLEKLKNDKYPAIRKKSSILKTKIVKIQNTV
mgnify:CR=1 FL=1